MAKRFYIYVYCLAFLSLFTSFQSNQYSLKGRIKGIDRGWIYIKHRQTNTIDSALITKGFFEVTGKTETPEFCNLGTGNSGKREFYFGFFLKAGDMTLHANKDSLFDAAVRIDGYEVQKEFTRFQIQMRPIDVMSNKIWETEKTNQNQSNLNLQLKELDAKRKEIIWNYALQYPDSYITAFEASSYLIEKEDLDKLERIYFGMNSILRQWYYSVKIKKHLQENNRNIGEGRRGVP